MLDATWPAFPVFAFLGFILPLVPLSWHLQAWNSSTCYYIFWSSIGSLNLFVNAILWRDTAVNLAPVWCDISTRITIGVSVGIPAASLCINRRLYSIASVKTVSITRQEKRRAVLIDSLICVGLPLVCMVLAYIVQGHRFDVWEQLGCYPALYDSIPYFFLVCSWPILLGLVSATYCVLSLRAFLQRQAAFSEFLKSNENITVSRYFRLMALAMTEIICTIPLATYVIVLDSIQGVRPWTSWADVHSNFGRVELIPAVIWRSSHLVVILVEFIRWSVPICGILFFLFFGFAEEARRNYKLAYGFILKRLGFKPTSDRIISNKGLPVYMPPRPAHHKRMSSSTTSFTGTIPAPKYSPRQSLAGHGLTIDTKKQLPVLPTSSFTPTAEEMTMITNMLAISDSRITLATPDPAFVRRSMACTEYTLEAITINTPTSFTHSISTPTTATVVDTPTTSTYSVYTPSAHDPRMSFSPSSPHHHA